MKWNRIGYLWLVLWVIPLITFAQIPERPNPPKLVNDLADILDAGQEQSLEQILVQFNNETSTQIVVVTVPSLNGYDRADFAYRIGETWGVGQQGKNNGIVMLVKPKVGNERGEVYISVGYGLEGVIPDAVANRQVIDNEMIPRFKENDYYGGIVQGATVIMNLARGEYTAQEYAGNQSSEGGGGAIILFIILIFIFIILPIMRGKSKVHSAGKKDIPLWLLLSLMNSGKRHGGSFGDFSSGRGPFGGGFGGGGGGFGGFGGGSFGGGGAGGSW